MPPIEQLAAAAFANQTSPDLAASFFQPLIDAVKPIMGTASAIVGGLFGLYLIFVITRLYFEKKKVKLLKDIRYELRLLNAHFNVKKPLKESRIKRAFSRIFRRKKLTNKLKHEN